MLRKSYHFLLAGLIIFIHPSCDALLNTEEFEITEPTEGSTHQAHEGVVVRWDISGECEGGSIDLFFSTDSSDNWESASPYGITNDGLYVWFPEYNDFQTDKVCKLKIQRQWQDDCESESEPFMVLADSSYFEIISPSPGESWFSGTIDTIKWNAYGSVSGGGWYNRPDIYVSIGLGDWQLIADEAYNTLPYDWEVPEVYVTNDQCRIKFVEDSIQSISEFFTIVSSDDQSEIITLIHPNGSEIWHEQTEQTISWYTTGDIGGNEVLIGYSLDGGQTWKDALGTSYSTSSPPHYNWSHTSNDGSFTWTLPNISDTTSACLVGIWSDAQTSIYKTSQTLFTVTPDSNYYRLIQPNGGEIFQKNTARSIVWESGGDVGSLELHYSLFGGESWYVIDANESNDGVFLWQVPSVQGTNDACKIKLVDRSRPDWFDVSDQNFTIADTVIFNDFDISFEQNEDLEQWDFGNWQINSESAFHGTNSIEKSNANSQLTSPLVTVGEGFIRFFVFSDFNHNYTKLILNVLQDGSSILTKASYRSDLNDESWTLVEHYLEGGTYAFQWEFDGVYTSEYVRIDAISFP